MDDVLDERFRPPGGGGERNSFRCASVSEFSGNRGAGMKGGRLWQETFAPPNSFPNTSAA